LTLPNMLQGVTPVNSQSNRNITPVCTLHYRSQSAHGRMLVWTSC